MTVVYPYPHASTAVPLVASVALAAVRPVVLAPVAADRHYLCAPLPVAADRHYLCAPLPVVADRQYLCTPPSAHLAALLVLLGGSLGLPDV